MFNERCIRDVKNFLSQHPQKQYSSYQIARILKWEWDVTEITCALKILILRGEVERRGYF